MVLGFPGSITLSINLPTTERARWP